MQLFTLLVLAFNLTSFTARADVEPADLRLANTKDFHTAESKKRDFYIKNGVWIGGDQAIDQAELKDLRFAKKEGFERIVVDLVLKKSPNASGVEKAPYFQVEVSQDQLRATVTFFGNISSSLKTEVATASFKKSVLIQAVEIFPAMEKDRMSFTLHFKSKASVEVFELSQPTRVILDSKK